MCKSDAYPCFLFPQDAVEKAKMIGQLQESNSILKGQVAGLQNDHADLKEVVRKQGILVQEHEEILGSGKIEKLFQLLILTRDFFLHCCALCNHFCQQQREIFAKICHT